VADLSFISLSLVLPALRSVAVSGADFLLLVKPQFEVGKETVPRGGVVRDPRLWRATIDGVVASGRSQGLGLAGATAAVPPGPAGNREFFVHLREGAAADERVVEEALEEARP
jgi:23S rRNA (cytidine1920-2'-O)/16S rRNA (cytidine1409-2'-O)-methyltransferase